MVWCLLKSKFLAFPITEPTWTTCFGLWVYGQFEYKLKPLRPSDTIWHHELWQHWLMQWLVTWRYQAITWPKVDIINVKKVSMHNFQSVIRSQWVNLLAREKMANFFEDNSFKFTILIENMLISSQINVLLGAIWQKLSLIQIVAWCWIIDMPISESLLTLFTNTYMRQMFILISADRDKNWRNYIVACCKT